MPPKARLIRRAPLSERIKAYLDPYDFLLWLAEELNDDAYDAWLQAWSAPIALVLNVLFILARGASQADGQRGADDVFGDLNDRRGSGWVAWFATFLVHFLTLLSCLNALYTFFRKRHYRLFEQPIDIAPNTPSASRVRVDSSPLSSSPLRYLQHVMSSATASSRAYPDAEREVWEVNIWDPKPFNLSLFTLFSPGHVLMYYSLLPPAALDPRPSVTVITAVVYAALLSVQLIFLKSSFTQQAKDSALVHGEVMNEYDTKYVRPNLHRPVRSVGIQAGDAARTPKGRRVREVDVYTPTTIINRGFKVNPNPNYASQYDPNNLLSPDEDRSFTGVTRSNSTPILQHTPSNYVNGYTQSIARPTPGTEVSTLGPADFSSPIKSHQERLRERSPAKGDGGSLGVYSHAASPLRKAASYNQLRSGQAGGDVRKKPAGESPLKRVSLPGSARTGRADGADARRRRETGRY